MILKSPQFTSSVCFLLFPATTKSQFIEISSETVHVGDDVTLSCIVEDDQDTEDVRNYVWNLNSESSNIFLSIFFILLPPPLRLYSFSSIFLFLFFLCSSANFCDAIQIKKSSTTNILHCATTSC